MIYIVHMDLLEGKKSFREMTDKEVINLCKKDDDGRHIVCNDISELEKIWNGEDCYDMFYPDDSYIRVIDSKKDYFPVSMISRTDLQWKGFDTSNVTDEMMERIASLWSGRMNKMDSPGMWLAFGFFIATSMLQSRQYQAIGKMAHQMDSKNPAPKPTSFNQKRLMEKWT